MGIADNSTAWRAKARAAYGRLRLASLNNPQLLSYLEEFKETYSEAAMKASAKAWAYIIGGVVLVIAIIDILIILSERK